MVTKIPQQFGYCPYFIGYWGIDRIYVGDVGWGVLKMLTCGGIGIWWLIDLFLITDVTKRKNLEMQVMF